MDFLTYRKFYEQEDVDALTEVLKENGIDYEIGEDRENLNVLMGDRKLGGQYVIRLKGEDFEKADKLLSTESEKQIGSVDKDHYLFDFTDEELMDILNKPDEWNEFDYNLAMKILKDRGKQVDEKTIEILKKERMEELSRPEEGNKLAITIGYVFAVMGGILGIIIGWHLMTFRKTVPNGERVYAYSWATRKHGQRILIIGSILFITGLVIRILTLNMD